MSLSRLNVLEVTALSLDPDTITIGDIMRGEVVTVRADQSPLHKANVGKVAKEAIKATETKMRCAGAIPRGQCRRLGPMHSMRSSIAVPGAPVRFSAMRASVARAEGKQSSRRSYPSVRSSPDPVQDLSRCALNAPDRTARKADNDGNNHVHVRRNAKLLLHIGFVEDRNFKSDSRCQGACRTQQA